METCRSNFKYDVQNYKFPVCIVLQVEHVLPLLKKGIGIHHGGLLPLLKETIEILFSEGLIKVQVIYYCKVFYVSCFIIPTSNRSKLVG